jgi:hypothetical protein
LAELFLEGVPVGHVVSEGIPREEGASVVEEGSEDVYHGAAAAAEDVGGGAQEAAQRRISQAVAGW